MAQIVSYMTEEEKIMIENVSEFLFLDSSSKFMKMQALEKCEKIAGSDEFKKFLKSKHDNSIKEEGVEHDEFL